MRCFVACVYYEEGNFNPHTRLSATKKMEGKNEGRKTKE